MATYDVSARETTYLSFIVEADTPAEAIEKAKQQYEQGLALIGDTELDRTTLEVCGVYGGVN
jgi:hypothetical protein